MTDPTLAVSQWSLGGLMFGRNTGIEVTDFDYGGKPDTDSGDTRLPGEDGVRFGFDTLGSRALTFEMLVNATSAEGARQSWRALSGQWNASNVRSSSGSVTYLRMNLPGSETLRVYGRPRKFAVASGNGKWVGINAGAVPIVADFAAADAKFYSDTLVTETLSLLPDESGGFVWPISWPVYFQPGGTQAGILTNDGDMPTWPIIKFIGPVSNPTFKYVGTNRSITLNTILADGQSVTIDTRPWVRTTLRENGGSYAGYLRGSRLSDMYLAPGTSEVSFKGNDSTGNARCSISYRSAYSTP